MNVFCVYFFSIAPFQGCGNRHIEETSIEQIFIIAWNTIIDNIENCREKCKEQINDKDLLKAYRAKDFLKLTENAECISDVDTDFMLRVLDKIVIYENGNIVIKFYDGTEIEY